MGEGGRKRVGEAMEGRERGACLGLGSKRRGGGVVGLGMVLCLMVVVDGLRGAAVERAEGAEGMVVAGHRAAAEVGVKLLKAGGSAMDAAVGTSLALGVAEPYGSGLGGKVALLYYEAQSGEVHYIDGMDLAGGGIEVEALARMGVNERAQGGHAVAVPGLVAGLALGHEKWGVLEWEDVVLPAARLAEGGVEVVAGMPVFFERRIERIQSQAETARLYLIAGRVPKVGERLVNADLGWTLREIAAGGAKAFYEGEIAERIVEAVVGTGGWMTVADLAEYRARLGKPVKVEIAGREIYAGGVPTTGGASSLLAMRVLEGYAWNMDAGFRTAANVDGWARALRHIYPHIQAKVADHAGAGLAVEALLGERFVGALRAKAFGEGGGPERGGVGAGIEAHQAHEAALGGWTTHFVVVDGRGNIASVTQSLSHHFGSGVTAAGTGILLNNSLTNFSYRGRGGVNYAAGGKRPRSTIAPMLVLRDGVPELAFGLPGGGRIPTTTLAFLVDVLVFGRPVGEAIAAPRLHLRRDAAAQARSRVIEVEAGVDGALVAALEALGWEVERVADTEYFGGLNAVEIGVGGLTGWADQRRTNAAVGY